MLVHHTDHKHITHESHGSIQRDARLELLACFASHTGDMEKGWIDLVKPKQGLDTRHHKLGPTSSGQVVEDSPLHTTVS